ncbi:MAG: hypothetical protein LBU85_12245 [Treponema sp.]|jgi:hypothetical protein|nr:hypothetical protein [Treponema sp.]
MFQRVFEGVNFSYFHERKTNQYRLYLRKYDIDIMLKDYDAVLFRQQIELINSEPKTDIKARIERAIKIHFYFRYACPMPQFAKT